MFLNLGQKIYTLFNASSMKVNNMYTHKAEQHYFDLYYPIITDHLAPNSRILDIGCQNGRFTIPLANEGHKLTATDIDDEYFDFIKSHLEDSSSVEFAKEEITTTLSSQPQDHFDSILCVELLYTMKNTSELLNGLAKLMKPNGLLITSHRTLGFYVYRYLKEKNFKDLHKVMDNKHPAFNCQTAEEIRKIYTQAGYQVEEIKPIGMFSGFSKDPFSFIANPELLNPTELNNLLELENSPQLQSLFMNNARYLLVVARINK